MKLPKPNHGDTIIEVMIALAIAAFAIGSAYAVASRALNEAISARERNQALNIVESQIAALKLRNKLDPANFDSTFAASNMNFCLDESASDPANGNWGHYDNNASPLDTLVAATSGGSPNSSKPYNYECARNDSGQTDSSPSNQKYFINIATTTPNGPSGTNPTVYAVSARWNNLGGGPVNIAQVYYRAK